MPVLEPNTAWLTACRASRSPAASRGPPAHATKPKRSIKRSDSRAAPGGRVSNTAGGNAAARAQVPLRQTLEEHRWLSRSRPQRTSTSAVTWRPLFRRAAARRPHGAAAEVTEIDGFSFARANGSRQDACPPLNRRDPGKHRSFRNPERLLHKPIRNLARRLGGGITHADATYSGGQLGERVRYGGNC